MTQSLIDTPDTHPAPVVHEAQDEAPAEAVTPHEAESPKRLSQVEAELHTLTLAIEFAPQAAANYLARGDVHRRRGDVNAARADYQQAHDLAEAEMVAARWGFADWALRDTALQRLIEMGEDV